MSKPNLTKLKLVNPKHSEKIGSEVENVVQSIKNHIFDVYKNISDDKAVNLEFLKFLCCILESVDLVQSSNPVYRIDKKKLIIRIMCDLFPVKVNPDYFSAAGFPLRKRKIFRAILKRSPQSKF
jgi:hypothetical protein